MGRGITLTHQFLSKDYCTNMTSKNQIKISQAELKTIYGDDYSMFEEKIIPNVFCPHGNELTTTIVDYQIYINELDDVTLKGKCVKCGKPVARYLETGTVEKYKRRAQRVKKNLKKVGFEI